MLIVTVKNIDADSFALPTLYGKTTLQNYKIFPNPQGGMLISCFIVVVLFITKHPKPCKTSFG